jgi:hypothetical protein
MFAVIATDRQSGNKNRCQNNTQSAHISIPPQTTVILEYMAKQPGSQRD